MQKNKRINEGIIASRVKVISEDGEQLGVMSTDSAIELAEEKGLDLVEIGAQDGVVLTKMMDYGKFLFKKQKNISKSKGNSKKNDLKTIRITYKIGEYDLGIRRKQADKFYKDGHPLKVVLMLRGRENQYVKQAAEKVETFVNSLEDIYKLDGNISKSGNTFSAMLSPKK